MNQAEIENMIQRYAAAEMAVLEGKSITFNGQSMAMENLSEIRKGRDVWERRLANLLATRRGRPMYKVARFP
ncbi:hypothetical protein RSG63_004197 [Yersinia enterocolitica]|uniref:Primosomal replication protein PriB/PriC domain protein n=1 Tax=Yersinia intermedia TaxID=631 RepID=A0ABX6F9W5_YERIN|nr:hypothetical protein [Yersinia intermedia]EKN3779766.1 hypothetical protein [Yersinia enterocolitica]ELI8374821.1 hypothetical protein [Yersinia enterocolitica]OVZ73007.1 hypothetical protein CBW55_22305 [Yersinia intermedia]QGR64668.1 hypothetical protein FOC38_01140 [Yersinia intermedia]QGR65505.1 hypothetical protein FOC38_05785 [Yersinia intermedia]